ncbi:methyltransferase domain-containing protein [Patescibacteria group bacterium]
MSNGKLYNLQELSVMLANVDRTLVSLLARRMDLALQVFAFKKSQALKKAKEEGKDPAEAKLKIEVIRADKEIERVDKAAIWAELIGLNPLFARGMMYEIINESCKVQLGAMQSDKADIRFDDHATSDEWYEALKANLLELTRHVASGYDQAYSEQASFSTAIYRQFEQRIIQGLIDKLPNKSLALDLGCATGPMTFHLADYFTQVQGVDISPEMIKIAQEKKQTLSIDNVAFSVADIEQGLEVSDGTVSLVVLNLGTASDVRNLKTVMKEIERVLRPGGKVLLSFYNKDALIYQFDFIPWPVSLMAEINFKAQCLEVHIPEHEPFLVYANGYNAEEAEAMFQGKMEMDDVFSFPTISPILPKHLLENDKIRQQIELVERFLENSTSGSYLIATGTKR